MAGRRTSARAISMKRSSLCCSRSARTAASGSSPTMRSARRALRRNAASSSRCRGVHSSAWRKLTRPPIVAPIITFSSTEASPMMRGVWKVRAMPSPARLCGAAASSCRAPMATAPLSGAAKPESTLSVVVLPLPLGPISPCTSPGRSARSSPSMARTPPKASVTPRMARLSRAGAVIEHGGEQLRPRHDGTVAFQRPGGS